ncbi:MAG: DegQ family serine endoprotease [Aquisalimonadaceae bacterium]
MYQYLKQSRELLLPVTLLLALTAFAGIAQARDLPAFTKLVKENSPAVVNISTTQSRAGGGSSRGGVPELPEDHPFHEFFERFGDEGPEGGPAPSPGPFEGQSLGSGFIISDDGDIITNYHVVQNASEIVVRLSDRRQYTAKVVGYDERSDLALLTIDAEDLPTVKLGNSAGMEVGEWVLAIGSPFGFEHSATAGIISAKQRSLPQDNYVPFLQTDVAINPGNSGGPLFNLNGEVIGINSHIYSRSGGFMGLSFAIPIELAMNVVDQLRNTGRVARGWLGVLIQDVNRDLAESFGMDRPYGALVAQVVPDSPAADAGLEVGDVIVRFEGQEISTSSALPPMVGRMPVDANVTLDVIREGDTREVTVNLGELPDEQERASRGPAEAEPPADTELLGLRIRDLTPEEREQAGLDQGGVLVERVGDGPGAGAGIRRSDVITMMNQKRIGSVEDFRRVVKDLPRGRSVPVLVQRDGGPRFFAFRLSEDG